MPILGKLPEIAPFSEHDALEAARVGTSGIYHAACRTLAFDWAEALAILEQLFKGAFFVLQALQFARTGAYPRTKAELSEHLEGEEALVLEVGRNWETHIPSDDAELAGLAAKASEVLQAGGSICWGKANLLAALLRANGIPSGISYQVLTKGSRPIRGTWCMP